MPWTPSHTSAAAVMREDHDPFAYILSRPTLAQPERCTCWMRSPRRVFYVMIMTHVHYIRVRSRACVLFFVVVRWLSAPSPAPHKEGQGSRPGTAVYVAEQSQGGGGAATMIIVTCVCTPIYSASRPSQAEEAGSRAAQGAAAGNGWTATAATPNLHPAPPPTPREGPPGEVGHPYTKICVRAKPVTGRRRSAVLRSM